MSGTYGIDKEDVIAGMQEDLDLLAGVAIPETYSLPFPPILLSFWAALVHSVTNIGTSVAERFPKLAIGIPRGHAKSTVIKLFMLYCILFTHKKFIAVICASSDLAENILLDVMDMLESPNIITLFGRWDLQVKRDRTDSKVFFFRGRQITLAAIGSQGNFRGLNLGNSRPDVMIFDDAQTKACAESMTDSRKFLNKFSSDFMKAKSPTDCSFIYIGNMYKELILEYHDDGTPKVRGCLLHNLHLDPDWVSYISGAILADGSTLWEELHPMEVLLAELAGDTRLGNDDEWFAEVQNDPTFKRAMSFDAGKVPELDPHIHQTGYPHSAYMVLDPSLGKKKSDDQAVGVFRVYDQTPIMEDLKVYKMDIKLLTRELIEYALDHDIPVIFTEDYGSQAIILGWFNHWIEYLKIEGLHIQGINRGRLSKTQAIIDYLKGLMAGTQLLSPKVRSSVITQATNFDVTKANNKDDILDVGYYGNLVMADEELKQYAELPLYMLETSIHSYAVESRSDSEAIGASGSYHISTYR